ERAGAVHRVGEADRVAEHSLRRAFEPEIVGRNHSAIDSDRMHDPQLLKLTHEGEVRINVAIPAPHFEYAAGFRFAFLLLHRRDVIAEYRVFYRNHELGVVVIIAEIGMAVRIVPDADLTFPKAVG